MEKKRLAEALRKLKATEDGGLHIHIHLDQKASSQEEKKEKPNWVDENGFVKVAGMSPSVS